ncbi:hypothetical protein H6P81_019102 [Aristolochia fimbriata]|uniref:Phloem protein 2 n=1 Tax=Aristolochia fimbriata TaxID=158543 RepID=A0AAV7DQW7_ARIFI|nr:hypothetical protein H6P81_019102 [Aristolochia fimbriata]
MAGSHYKGLPSSQIWKESIKAFEIEPRQLDIIWGKDRRYWNINPNKREVELLQVCWLEVSKSIPFSAFKGKEGTYKVEFSVKMRPDAFGWNASPVYFMTKVGRAGGYRWFKCSLAGQSVDKEVVVPDNCVFEINRSQTSQEDVVIFGICNGSSFITYTFF